MLSKLLRNVLILLCISSYAPLCAMQKIKKFVAIKKQDKLHKQLRKAAQEGNCAQMRLVLGQPGIDVNAVDKYGDSALHAASKALDVDAFQLLLNAGADVNLQNKVGRTPLHCGLASHCSFGVSIQEFALQYKSRFELLGLCIKAGADVNVKDGNGFTPLREVLNDEWYQCEEYFNELVKSLKEKGGDPENLYCFHKIIKALLEAGACRYKETLPRKYAHWILVQAALAYYKSNWKGDEFNWRNIKHFIGRGVNVNEGLRDLYSSGNVVNKNEINFFLDYGADPAWCDRKNKSILCHAVGFGSEHGFLLLNHLPKHVLKKYRERVAIPFLLCCKRAEKGKGLFAVLPKEIKKLLWSYCLEYSIKRPIVAERLEWATVACKTKSSELCYMGGLSIASPVVLRPRSITPYELAKARWLGSAYLFDPGRLKANYGAEWEAQVDAFFPKILLK